MSKTFKISRDPYDTGEVLYNKAKIEIKEGMTFLVGKNGSGKSTLLNTIKKTIKKENIKYFSYSDEKDGRSNAFGKYGRYGRTDSLIRGLTSSEGQKVMQNFEDIISKMGHHAKNNQGEDLWVLVDGLDSGLSIDAMIELKDIFKLVLKTEKNKNVYIIMSVNQFEMVYDEDNPNSKRCLNIKTGNYIGFKDYNSYRKFITKN